MDAQHECAQLRRRHTLGLRARTESLQILTLLANPCSILGGFSRVRTTVVETLDMETTPKNPGTMEHDIPSKPSPRAERVCCVCIHKAYDSNPRRDAAPTCVACVGERLVWEWQILREGITCGWTVPLEVLVITAGALATTVAASMDAIVMRLLQLCWLKILCARRADPLGPALQCGHVCALRRCPLDKGEERSCRHEKRDSQDSLGLKLINIGQLLVLSDALQSWPGSRICLTHPGLSAFSISSTCPPAGAPQFPLRNPSRIVSWLNVL